MNGRYLIPANSKKSQLILGFFTGVDLAIFGVGVVFSVAMLMIFKTNSLGILLLMLSPALISAFLVMPVPNYHNVLTLISNIYLFFANRRRYYWKGWCVLRDNTKQ